MCCSEGSAMNRQQFLDQLAAELSSLAPEERDEAMKFYVEYLDEAGPEKEEEVLKELGSPQKVAAIIRANLGGVERCAGKGESSPAGTDFERSGLEPENVRAGRPRTAVRQRRAAYAKQQSRASGAASGVHPARCGSAFWAVCLEQFWALAGGVLGVIIGGVSAVVGVRLHWWSPCFFWSAIRQTAWFASHSPWPALHWAFWSHRAVFGPLAGLSPGRSILVSRLIRTVAEARWGGRP